MMPNKEYLEQIAKKLDALNKINGVDPNIKNNIFNDNFDTFGQIGKSALEYLERKKLELPDRSINPLFTDHNNY